jgi:hypothetical protein
VKATDGNLYGTSEFDGTAELGNVFEISLSGTQLYSYSMLGYPNDGSLPFSGLVQATDGKFYGTTYVGATRLAITAHLGAAQSLTSMTVSHYW